MIWEYIKSVWYNLFCGHKDNTYGKYYRVSHVHGFVDVEVIVDKTCKKCGHCTEVIISKNHGSYLEMENLIKSLEDKGYKNLEDLI